ncbi:MAG: asparaginase [Planctomycetota bacterium]
MTPSETERANPVLVRLRRGSSVESFHRGSWVVVDRTGAVVASSGDVDAPVFARSSIKALQALPLVESGAADRFGFTPADLALAISSHNGESRHTEGATAILARLGLDASALRCGAQAPTDPEAKRRLRERDAKPGAIHNNCSGKHAGFLALGAHLGADPKSYLDERAPVQRAVRAAIAEMCSLDPATLETAIDGCSAPTFRLPLRAMALAFARLAEPSGLAATRRAAAVRLLDAAAEHPAMVAGEYKRLDTALLRVTNGRVFPKVGAEAVYVIAARDRGLGLALKIDDGAQRAMHAAVVALCDRFQLVDRRALDELRDFGPGPLRNWAGLEVGSTDVELA